MRIFNIFLVFILLVFVAQGAYRSHRRHHNIKKNLDKNEKHQNLRHMIRNLKKSFKSIMEKRLTIQDNSYDSDLEEANKSDILGPEAIMRGWVKFLTFYPSEEQTLDETPTKFYVNYEYGKQRDYLGEQEYEEKSDCSDDFAEQNQNKHKPLNDEQQRSIFDSDEDDYNKKNQPTETYEEWEQRHEAIYEQGETDSDSDWEQKYYKKFVQKQAISGIPGDTFFYFILNNHSLFVLTHYEEQISNVEKRLDLEGIQPVEDLDETVSGYCFRLTSNSGEVWNLCVSTKDEKYEWMYKINEVIESLNY